MSDNEDQIDSKAILLTQNAAKAAHIETYIVKDAESSTQNIELSGTLIPNNDQRFDELSYVGGRIDYLAIPSSGVQLNKGDLIARMTADVKEVEQSIINSFETLSREPFTILLVLASMLVLSWQLTLFVLLFFPVAGFIIARVGKTLKAQSLKAQQETGLLLSFFEETLGKLMVIKSFTAEPYFNQKFNKRLRLLLQELKLH